MVARLLISSTPILANSRRHIPDSTMDQSAASGGLATPDRSIRGAYDRWSEQHDEDTSPTRELDGEVLPEQDVLRAADCFTWNTLSVPNSGERKKLAVPRETFSREDALAT